jgi:amidophosphoribosyltransferase
MCGVVAFCNHASAAPLAQLALFSQQHRGQESAGIVTAHEGQLHAHRGMGLVQDVLTPSEVGRLVGRVAVGHVRYSTAGGSRLFNAQPLVMQTGRGSLAVGHNGNITNAAELRAELEDHGALFHGTADTEVILHLVARAGTPTVDNVVTALRQLRGAFSLVFLLQPPNGPPSVVAVRDPWGFRPLVMGTLDGGVVFASETCALDVIDAEYTRPLEPGEMVVVTDGKVQSLLPFPAMQPSACVFEQVYFARPDSVADGGLVFAARVEMGRQLAREMAHVGADLVVPVPDSGIPAALGFSRQGGVPYEVGLIRNHYVGRTFIQPGQLKRESAVRMKLHPMRQLLEGKRVVLVDDSIVRGTTSRSIVTLLRRAGVKEVHLAISCPPIVGPCHFGIDTPDEQHLLAARKSPAEVVEYLGVDSLHHLSLAGLLRAASPPEGDRTNTGGATGHCAACFTREYPPGALVQIGQRPTV